MLERIDERRRLPDRRHPGRRQPAELEREDVDRRQRQEERRDRDRGEARRPWRCSRATEYCLTAESTPIGHGDEQREDLHGQHQPEGRPEPLADLLRDRLPIRDRR